GAFRRIEIEIGVLAVSSDEAVAFERAADTLGDLLHERLQLTLRWGGDAAEHGRRRAGEKSPVEHEHVEMHIEIQRGAEALNQRDGAGGALAARELRFAKNEARDRAV